VGGTEGHGGRDIVDHVGGKNFLHGFTASIALLLDA
jgi:small ligand-binding sensory domain FIST